MDEFYSLGFLANRTSIALSKAVNAAFAEEGIDLPHSQFIVLRCLYYRDGLSQLEIANTLSKDAAAIKRTIDNLEKKGFVTRSQVRMLKNAVYITDKGKAVMPQLLSVGNNVIEKAFNGMSLHKRKIVLTALDDIYNNLNK